MNEFLESAHLWFPGMVAMLCLTCSSGFFSASETALFYLSHDELRGFRTGKSRERAVAILLSDPDRLLTAVLFWNLVINLSYFSVSVVVTHRLVDAGLQVSAAVFGLMSLLGIILLGEVLPKSSAVVFRRRLAPLVVWPLAFSVRVLDPITPFLRNVTRIARRTFWPHIGREPFLDAEDLERAVEATELSSDVIRQERQVLHNILDLSEIIVEEVMRPRGTYLSLNAPVNLADLHGEVPPGDYLIIQQTDSEDIGGVVPLTNFSSLPETDLQFAAEDVIHVPWCANLAFTLQQIRNKFCSVASVVNEYGETVGIVTYEDLLDTVLMPQPSRAKRVLRREPVLEIAPGRFHVDGITTLRYLCKRLGIQFAPAGDDFLTVAGLLYDKLEHIPIVGDECFWQGFHIKVIDVSKRGQIRAMISRPEESANVIGRSDETGEE